jgi:hypothetical protein
MRLGVDEVGVTELMGVTEHARAMATAASALLLESLAGPASLIAPVPPPGQGDPEVEALLGEIAAWAEGALGESQPPLIWRILARNGHYLGATWRKEAALMAAGALTARDKRRVALSVAMATRADRVGHPPVPLTAPRPRGQAGRPPHSMKRTSEPNVG